MYFVIAGDFRPQTFRVKPKDIQTKVGDEIVLPCEVDNRAGEVQWTKDGAALGKLKTYPNNPINCLIGDANANRRTKAPNSFIKLSKDNTLLCKCACTLAVPKFQLGKYLYSRKPYVKIRRNID